MARHQPLRRRPNGFTLLELAVGIVLAGSLSLVVAGMFKTGIVSARRSITELDHLRNARRAVQGDGRTRGIGSDVRLTTRVVATAASTLTLEDAVGTRTVYERTPSGALLVTRGAASAVQAEKLASLAFAYYARNEDFTVSETTTPASAALVAETFDVEAGGRKVRHFAGARLRVRP